MDNDIELMAKFFVERIPKYQQDIALFASEMLEFTPDDWQEDVFKDIVEADRVSVKSGQGVGKTGVESILVVWFLSLFPNAKVVCTAPTARQLNDVLWAEISKWLSRSPVLSQVLRWTKTYVYMVGQEERWFATARTATKPENMQGFHEDNMLFIVDEASGISEPIMEAILGTLTGANNKLVLMGNPTKTSGTFYDSHTKARKHYRCHTVNSENSPRTSKENIQQLAEKYGKNSNVYRVRVLGEFPEQEDDVFIPLSLIEKSVNTELEEQKVFKIVFGVDVARYGDDETVIAQNVNNKITLPIVRHGQSLMQTVGDIVTLYKRAITEHADYKGPITVFIDDTGLGGGVTDRLEEVKREQSLTRLDIVPVNFGSKPPEDKNYADITTYMWGTVRDMMQSGELVIENDNDLVAQLSIRKYSLTSSGKLTLESKKDMKKRGVASPDRADAVALACMKSKKIYSAFVEKTAAIIIAAESVAKGYFQSINVGVAIGGSKSGTFIVATAITSGHKNAVVLKAIRIDGEVETSALESAYLQFCRTIVSQYGSISACYCESEERFLYKTIRNASDRSNLGIRVLSNAGTPETDRIRLTTRLLTQGRLKLTEDCAPLSQALSNAKWNDKLQSDGRAEAEETGALRAFEYTIEREANRFISAERGG